MGLDSGEKNSAPPLHTVGCQRLYPELITSQDREGEAASPWPLWKDRCVDRACGALSPPACARSSGALCSLALAGALPRGFCCYSSFTNKEASALKAAVAQSHVTWSLEPRVPTGVDFSQSPRCWLWAPHTAGVTCHWHRAAAARDWLISRS